MGVDLSLYAAAMLEEHGCVSVTEEVQTEIDETARHLYETLHGLFGAMDENGAFVALIRAALNDPKLGSACRYCDYHSPVEPCGDCPSQGRSANEPWVERAVLSRLREFTAEWHRTRAREPLNSSRARSGDNKFSS